MWLTSFGILFVNLDPKNHDSEKANVLQYYRCASVVCNICHISQLLSQREYIQFIIWIGQSLKCFNICNVMCFCLFFFKVCQIIQKCDQKPFHVSESASFSPCFTIYLPNVFLGEVVCNSFNWILCGVGWDQYLAIIRIIRSFSYTCYTCSAMYWTDLTVNRIYLFIEAELLFENCLISNYQKFTKKVFVDSSTSDF